MFSSLPKLADRAFVIGFLVPVLVTIGAVLIEFQECRWVAHVGHQLLYAGDLGKLTAFAASAILAALLLLLINRPIYRALEGYWGPATWKPFKDYAQKQWTKADAQRVTLRQAATNAPRGAAKDAAVVRYRQYLRNLRKIFPREIDNVLPTKFGNANRAFEGYALEVYKVEAIIIWPRLAAILPKTISDALTDARAQVNCFANISVLTGILLIARLLTWSGEGIWRSVVGSAIPYGTASMASVLWGGVGILGLGLIALGSYQMAIERAYALGTQVKVAFDLILPQLPQKLGLLFPDDEESRKDFWAALEETYYFQNPLERIVYIRPPNPEPTSPEGKEIQEKEAWPEENDEDGGDED